MVQSKMHFENMELYDYTTILITLTIQNSFVKDLLFCNNPYLPLPWQLLICSYHYSFGSSSSSLSHLAYMSPLKL
jgi:hypothetical protein